MDQGMSLRIFYLLKMNDGLVLLVYYACVTCTDMIHYRLNQIDLYLNDWDKRLSDWVYSQVLVRVIVTWPANLTSQ